MSAEIRLAELVRLAAGREAEVFALDRDRVLRLALSGSQQRDVKREAVGLRAAHAAGVPVPAVHEIVVVDGRPGLIIDRLEGPDLLVELGRRPWLFWSVASTLGRIHAAVHDVDAPQELPALRDQLEAQLHSPLVPDDVRGDALERLSELPDGSRLCHSDFHPQNLLRSGHGYAVIDWSHAARGDPAADVARTRMLLGTGAPPPGTPAHMRALARVGRRIVVSGYMRAYRRETPLPASRVARWTPVVIAARLATGIPEERSTLLDLVRAT